MGCGTALCRLHFADPTSALALPRSAPRRIEAMRVQTVPRVRLPGIELTDEATRRRCSPPSTCAGLLSGESTYPMRLIQVEFAPNVTQLATLPTVRSQSTLVNSGVAE